MKRLSFLTFYSLASLAAQAAEFHVSVKGDDGNSGAATTPFRTIQHAANLARPGDVIMVHAGVYRERVDLPRGGSGCQGVACWQTSGTGAMTTFEFNPSAEFPKKSRLPVQCLYQS